MAVATSTVHYVHVQDVKSKYLIGVRERYLHPRPFDFMDYSEPPPRNDCVLAVQRSPRHLYKITLLHPSSSAGCLSPPPAGLKRLKDQCLSTPSTSTHAIISPSSAIKELSKSCTITPVFPTSVSPPYFSTRSPTLKGCSLHP